MDTNGKWLFRFIVHHSGETMVGDSFDEETLVEIPLKAKSEKKAFAEGEKMINEMTVEILESFYDSRIDDEDLIKIDKFHLIYKSIMSNPSRVIQQWF